MICSNGSVNRTGHIEHYYAEVGLSSEISGFVGTVIEFEMGTLEENTFLKSKLFCLTVLSPINFNLSVSRMITFSSCLT